MVQLLDPPFPLSPIFHKLNRCVEQAKVGLRTESPCGKLPAVRDVASCGWRSVPCARAKARLAGVGCKLALVTSLSTRILIHWREFRPTLVRDLERSGELDAVVTNLEKTILEKRAGMIEQGMSLEQADEMVRPMWMISDKDA